MPVVPHKLTPEVKDTYWVNLMGKGYPAPRKLFRWCTDRLKIKPSNKFIREVVQESGEAILVLGTRKAESQKRAATMDRHEQKRVRERLTPNAKLPNSRIYTPIEDWANDDVWLYLMQVKKPLGAQQQVAADDVPGGDLGRRMPAGGRYLHAKLRHQPLRLLGLHAGGPGPLHGGDDRQRRGKGVDDAAVGTAERTGRAERPRPPRLSPHRRAGAVVPRQHGGRALQARVAGALAAAGAARRRSRFAASVRRRCRRPSWSRWTSCGRSGGYGCKRSTSSRTRCRGFIEEVTGGRFLSRRPTMPCWARRTGSFCKAICGERRGLFHAADRVAGHRAAVSRHVAAAGDLRGPGGPAAGPAVCQRGGGRARFARSRRPSGTAIKRPADAAEADEVRPPQRHVVRGRAGRGRRGGVMILERLTLCNFCLYRGEQTFNLAPQRRNGKGRAHHPLRRNQRRRQDHRAGRDPTGPVRLAGPLLQARHAGLRAVPPRVHSSRRCRRGRGFAGAELSLCRRRGRASVRGLPGLEPARPKGGGGTVRLARRRPRPLALGQLEPDGRGAGAAGHLAVVLLRRRENPLPGRGRELQRGSRLRHQVAAGARSGRAADRRRRRPWNRASCGRSDRTRRPDEIAKLESQIQEHDAQLAAIREQAASLETEGHGALAMVRQAERRFAARGGEYWKERESRQQRRGEVQNQESTIEGQLASLAAGGLPLALLPDLLASVAEQDEREPTARQARSLLELLKQRDAELLAGASRRPGSRPRRLPPFASSRTRTAPAREAAASHVESRLALSDCGPRRAAPSSAAGIAREHRGSRPAAGPTDEVKQERESLERAIAAAPDDAAIKEVAEQYRKAIEEQATVSRQDAAACRAGEERQGRSRSPGDAKAETRRQADGGGDRHARRPPAWRSWPRGPARP